MYYANKITVELAVQKSLSKEPYSLSKEPYSLSQEPYFLSEEPF